MVVLCQSKEQIVNLNNFNSLYFERKNLKDSYRNKYLLKVDIGSKTYILGSYYSVIICKQVYAEVLDNYLNHPETLLYKMPESDKIALDHSIESTIVDLGKITLDEITKNTRNLQRR